MVISVRYLWFVGYPQGSAEVLEPTAAYGPTEAVEPTGAIGTTEDLGLSDAHGATLSSRLPMRPLPAKRATEPTRTVMVGDTDQVKTKGTQLWQKQNSNPASWRLSGGRTWANPR